MGELVFLPGAGGRTSFWRPVAERLAPLGRCLLFGWPGFGDEPLDPSIRSLDDLVDWLRPRLPPAPSHILAQSMGGVVAIRLALEAPERVASLLLTATSGGLDVARMGGADWRQDYRREFKEVPDWFVVDRTDLTARLGEVRVPTLILHGEADPICPPAVPELLCERIPGARAVCVRGGSHQFAEERPDEVAELARQHLVRVGGGARP